MKILQLTHKPPVPCIDGGCQAMYQITQCLLSAGSEVKVFSVATAKHPVVHTDDLLKYKEKTKFESIFVDTKVSFGKIVSAFVKKDSLQAYRFFSSEMNEKLITILAQGTFDVVIVESVFMGHYLETIRKYSLATILLRVHNIEFLIWERLAKQTKNPYKKVAFRYLSSSLKRFENSLFSKIDGYLPITEVDNQYFKVRYPNLSSKVISFSIKLSDYNYKEPNFQENNLTFFHLGSMNWQPNIEGMSWFLDNVWKQAAEKYPHLTFVIAGKGNKEWFAHKSYKNVHIFDFVEDAQQFMNEHNIMIVPLLSGSGMRIKIIEGMALGKPIITTTIGAEGIEVTHRDNIFIADTPEEMMQTIGFCVNHTEKCVEIGKNARKLVEEKYTQERVVGELMEFVNSNLQQ
ncbi:MAG: glycosyltransferase family 4 protein [Bacteroidales bacterium]|jgi:glycosyltransferase involved in cell wall biosynthesis|nr:glycosyltransferase family 4 protein [Bacteroidales bacterium]